MRIRKPYITVAALMFLSGVCGAAGGLLVEHYYNSTAGSVVSEVMPQASRANLTSASSAESVPSLVSHVSPAVVSITTQSTTYSFFGGPISEDGAGTGMILTSDGYILTNNHVLPVNSGAITVTTQSGNQYTAKVIATNQNEDLALIKVNASNLPTVTLGDSSQEAVGDSVVAIGNALGQFQNSVMTGVVSGLNRSVEASDEDGLDGESLSGLLQVDAAINPGDSGGPLIDVSTGTVIGMDTAVSSDAQGIGFAIPINKAESFIAPYITTRTMS